MTTRAFILSLILCGLVASCAMSMPDAMEYEHQNLAHLKHPITGYADYQKFVAENK
jgi:hypothetical protein